MNNGGFWLPSSLLSDRALATIAATLTVGAVIYFFMRGGESPADGGEASQSGIPPAAVGTRALDETPPTPPGVGDSTGYYRNDASGLSFSYATRYYISSTIDSAEEKTVRLNKTADRKDIAPGLPNRAPYIQVSSLLNRADLSVDSLMRAWGEAILGSRFSQDADCKSITVAGVAGRRCTFYAGVERGGYREATFVKRGQWAFRFEAASPTSNDTVHTDIEVIMRSVKWFD